MVVVTAEEGAAVVEGSGTGTVVVVTAEEVEAGSGGESVLVVAVEEGGAVVEGSGTEPVVVATTDEVGAGGRGHPPKGWSLHPPYTRRRRLPSPTALRTVAAMPVSSTPPPSRDEYYPSSTGHVQDVRNTGFPGGGRIEVTRVRIGCSRREGAFGCCLPHEQEFGRFRTSTAQENPASRCRMVGG